MSDQVVQVPYEQADRLFSIVLAFEAQLSDTPPAWMDDEQVEQREADLQSVRASRAALAVLLGR